MTPAWNGTFLNGITKQRVAELLAADGVEVRETTLTLDDFAEADEIFSTGNYGKVMPCVRYEERELQPGPIFRRARELYFDYATGVPAR
jgi:branched-chain amino acid aminotransferase